MKRFMAMLLCAAMSLSLLAGCSTEDKSSGKSGDKEEKGTIIVGSKNFTEGYLLSEVYALALEDNGYTVDRMFNMSTDTLAPAMQNDEVDLYPEYTGTALTDILQEDLLTDTQEVYDLISKEYKDKWDIRWMELTDMEDKAAIVMRKDKAEELGITNLTELQAKSEGLKLGDGVNFADREDDLLRLNDIFGEFKFEVVKMDSSMQYPSLDDGTVDVIPGLTTDPQLVSGEYVVIEEDVPVWPPQYVAPIVRGEVLENSPELEGILNRVSEHLTTETMIEMLDKVVNGGEEYEAVAKDFYENQCK